MPDLIITGIPRSGTTLAAAIVDQMPDAFCLSEPESQVTLMHTSSGAEAFVDCLALEFAATRRLLLAGHALLDRRSYDGRPITNYFGMPDAYGRRTTCFEILPVSRKGLSPDFVLGAKHNALFASVLPEIVQCSQWRVVAVIRDPVPVLLSWSSLDLPISRGRLPAAERFWPQMGQLTRAEFGLVEKHIRIYDLFCRRFAAMGERISIVRYEEFVANPGVLLAACGMRAAPVTLSIGSPYTADERSRSSTTINHLIRMMAEAGGLPGICHFYPSYIGC